jgi:hypothetical protein
MTEVTILDKLKSTSAEYSEDLFEYVVRHYEDSMLSIGQDAIKADIERKEDKFEAAALRMVGVVNKAVYNAGKKFLHLGEDVLHATARELFRAEVQEQRHSFVSKTDRRFQVLYPVEAPYWI